MRWGYGLEVTCRPLDWLSMVLPIPSDGASGCLCTCRLSVWLLEVLPTPHTPEVL